jgi:hypothetical protein
MAHAIRDRDADMRVLRLVQERDQERQRRIRAERQASALRATLARVLAQRRKAEAERQDRPSQRVG